MIEQLLSPQLVAALGWTLLHTLWQGALFALLLGVVLILLRRYSAQARYLVAVGVLGAFCLTAGLTFYAQYEAPSTFSTPESAPTVRLTDGDAPADQNGPRRSARVTTSPAGSSGGTSSIVQQGKVYFVRHLPLLVTLWLMGVLVLQLRLLGQLAYLQRIKSFGTERFPDHWMAALADLPHRLNVSRPVRYLTSSRIQSPLTTGWLRPVIMLPSKMRTSLEDSQLLAIVAHELAHIRRNDFAVNVLQTLLTTFFFYHPGVWWISARIQEEREHSCDDLAVAATGKKVDYARTLVHLQEQELAAPRHSMAVGGDGFSGRIKRILGGYFGAATFGEGVVTTLLIGAVLSLAIGTTGQAQGSAVDPTTAVAVVDRSDDRANDEDFELLIRAIRAGDLELVTQRLERVSNLNRTDDNDLTPLMAAAAGNHAVIAALLIERNADVDYVNAIGRSALIEAASTGALEVARLLIKTGADINIKGANINPRGVSADLNALGVAAYEGQLEVARLLLSSGADPRGVPDAYLPLHLAASGGHAPVVRLLLDAGVDVDIRDGSRRTALMHAASKDQSRIVRMLLDAGADVGATDRRGRSAMHYATHEGTDYSIEGADRSIEEMTAELSDAEVDRLTREPELLVFPASSGKLSTVKLMLELGVGINLADAEGYTALSAASVNGQVEMVRYLLGRGARVQGTSGSALGSAMFMAARQDHPDVLRILAESGGRPDDGYHLRELSFPDSFIVLRHYHAAPPLVGAIIEGRYAALHALLRLGADANQTFAKTTYTLKVYATDPDWYKVREYNTDTLTELSTNLSHSDTWTPLLEAIIANKVELVALLLENGATPEYRTAEGMTALRLAEKIGNPEMIRLLR